MLVFPKGEYIPSLSPHIFPSPAPNMPESKKKPAAKASRRHNRPYLNPGGKVPTALPKHRVLVSRIAEQSHTVEVHHVTTFAGEHNPVTFHKNHPLRQLIYVPFTPLVHEDYLSITSTPNVIKGWCNFVEPATIRYEDQKPSRELLRHCPESVGVSPPLLRGLITINPWHMKYLRAMSAGWSNTIHLKSPIQNWMAKAQHLRAKYSSNDGV